MVRSSTQLPKAGGGCLVAAAMMIGQKEEAGLGIMGNTVPILKARCITFLPTYHLLWAVIKHYLPTYLGCLYKGVCNDKTPSIHPLVHSFIHSFIHSSLVKAL